MARHKLTVEEKIRGVKKALESPRTPARLKPGLRRYLDKFQGSR